MPKVLVADKISATGVALLKAQPGYEVVEAYGSTPEKVLALVADVDAILVRSETQITREVLAAAHALPQADADLLAWLVEQHLLMSTTAQRQDISDPVVVARFANKVADREHLDYLYLLTCADIAGTSPKLWNAWKDRLLADLYSATRFALRRGLENPVHANEIMAETRAKAMERLLGEGLDEAAVERIWAAYPDVGFLRYRPEQIAWQTRGIAESDAGDTVVLVRPHLQAGGLEVFVRALDLVVRRLFLLEEPLDPAEQLLDPFADS